MATEEKRGSEKLMAAWKARTLTDESVKEIAAALEKSPAKVEGAVVTGGASPTGLRLSLRYDGDDGPWCGNDIFFWLKWHLTHGGGVIRPPRILINGITWPDLVRVDLDFGQVEGSVSAPGEIAQLGAGGIR
jgi:hypothetical protein